MLIPACSQPCTGDGCPQPVVCEANPAIVKPSAPKEFTVNSSFKACYKRGASDAVTFNLKVAESKIPTATVIFVVDIVVEDSNKDTTSVLAQFFNSQNDVSVSPNNIFLKGATKADLVAGLNATINFQFKSDSPVGDPYYFVISLFRGDGSTSNGNDLIGRIIYKFRTAE